MRVSNFAAILITTTTAAAAIVEPQNATSEVQTPVRAPVGENQDGACSPAWHRCDTRDLCCPSGTSCGYDNLAREGEEEEAELVVVCCPHNTICYSLDDPTMAFVRTSNGTWSNRRQWKGWIAAAVAVAYGVGNWRRRGW
jgi:hypothetical protein